MKKILVITISAIISLACLYGIVRLVYYLKTDIFLSSGKKSYLHWEFVQIRAKIKNKKLSEIYRNEPFYVSVFKNGERVTTIGGLGKIPLKYNSKAMLWEGKWPCPWNAATGQYRICPAGSENIKYKEGRFLITRRDLKNYLRSPIGVLTFENASSLDKMKIVNPDGKMSGWRGMFDWAEFVGADAVWYLAGQTRAESKTPDERFPWGEQNISKLPQMGIEAHKRGMKFGAYAIAYLTFGRRKYKNYVYAFDYNSSKNGPLETRSISLTDEKRVADIIKFVKILNDIDEVDYIGLDYIRNVQGGYELVDEFVSDMDVKLPEAWEKLNCRQRMGWLANEKVSRKNMKLIDQWQWWRAHKISKIINRITTEVKLKKPFWVFTLSWEKGWQHGQDPVMFADAGIDIDAIMLYEADRKQFDMLLNDWNSYIKRNEANLIIGNVVDWNLHQKTTNPPAPLEFYNRLIEATNRIYNDSTVEGVFIHDLPRALWGRIRPYSSKEWLLAGASAITEMKRINKISPVEIKIVLEQKIHARQEFMIPVIVRNLSSKKVYRNFKVKPYLIGGDVIGDREKTVAELSPGASKKIVFHGVVKNLSWERNLKNMVAVQVRIDSKTWTAFEYVTVKQARVIQN